MSEVTVQSDRIRLVLQTPAEILSRLEMMSPADRAEISPDWLARIRASNAADPWTHGFRIVDRASGATIGNCGYKDPPDAEGVVEIAYGVEPGHQGRGYATEAAMAMVDFALGNDSVQRIRAHTLPCESASTRVLAKCGFRQLGEVMDPDDGLVWRWEISRAPG